MFHFTSHPLNEAAVAVGMPVTWQPLTNPGVRTSRIGLSSELDFIHSKGSGVSIVESR